MKKIKTICSILCAAVLFIGVGKILHYILVDDTSSYTRLTMHELYHADSNIDVLFVGSSHVYQSLNPEITDKIFSTEYVQCRFFIPGHGRILGNDKRNPCIP